MSILVASQLKWPTHKVALSNFNHSYGMSFTIFLRTNTPLQVLIPTSSTYYQWFLVVLNFAISWSRINGNYLRSPLPTFPKIGKKFRQLNEFFLVGTSMVIRSFRLDLATLDVVQYSITPMIHFSCINPFCTVSYHCYSRCIHQSPTRPTDQPRRD